MKRACFIGRFQPWHLGHEWLIRQKANLSIPILVLVRDILPDDKNPFTTEQTIKMISNALSDIDVVVQSIPDIESVNWGRGVGYETNEYKPPENIGAISATEIRKQVLAGSDEWKSMVNNKIWNLVTTYLLDT